MTDRLLERCGVCTDEVSRDLEEALSSARSWGMREVEIQEFWGRPPTEASQADLDRARGLLGEHGLTVSAIGSQFLKPVTLGHVRPGQVGRDRAFVEELAVLRAEIRVARALGAPIVRSYAFRRDDMIGLGNPSPRLPRGGPLPDEMLEKVAEGLRVAAGIAADEGLILGLENVRSCWANSGHNSGRIIRAAGHPALQAIWDPGNDYVSGGQPYPEGYEAVRGRICHVHVKDARVVDGATGLIEWRAVGQGEVDWVAQFAALRRDGYSGGLSLETHWHPNGPTGQANRVEDSRISFEGMKAALAASLAPV
ncbi:MAG TPA: sugar phosphate isomerase/epimerase [Chloroflexota bacterium]|jgi:sugar phosphate isomerase/epimerase